MSEIKIISCSTGKVDYGTEREARCHLKNSGISKHGKVYRCPVCHGYHIGHKLNRKRAAAIKAREKRSEYESMIKLVYDICGVKSK